MTVSKETAIHRLQRAGFAGVAKHLSIFQNKNGNSGGWDGWFRGIYPDLIDIVWR